MKRVKAVWVSVCATVVAGIVALGCSGAEGPATTPAGDSPASGRSPISISSIDNTTRANEKGPGRVLATVTSADKHTFVFGQSASGALVVAENAPQNEARVLDRDLTSGSITDVYRRLTNGVNPPASLVKAEAEAAKHDPAVSPVTPPVGNVLSSPPRRPEVNNDWFYNTYCTPSFIAVCDEQNGPINSSLGQWVYGGNFDVWGYNYPSNSGTAALLEYVWNGSSWTFDWISGTIYPGNVWYEWWFNNPEYRSAELSISGFGGMAFGSPGLVASWTYATSTFNINVGGANLQTYWPHDSAVHCWEMENGFSHVTLTTGTNTNLTGINIGTAGVCPFQGEKDTNPKTMCCAGNSTGTTACAVISGDTENFNPGYCCVSMGGHRQGC